MVKEEVFLLEVWVMVTVYPVMMPLRSWERGSCQLSRMEVEEATAAVKFLGDPEGAAESCTH